MNNIEADVDCMGTNDEEEDVDNEREVAVMKKKLPNVMCHA